MNKFKFYFIVLITTVSLFSCSKKSDDEIEVVPPRDYATQYTVESALIETYLKTNYISVTQAPGKTEDQDVTILPLIAGKQSIWDQKEYQLLNRIVELHNIKYTLYYLVLREGTGTSPCNVDGVFTSYNGKYLQETTTNALTNITATQFEEVIYPQQFYDLFGTIRGWKEIFPQFKTGNSVSNSDNTVSHTDFGAGVMFIPSGLAYYNQAKSGIPQYSPLVFSFKLYEVQRLDHEYKIVNGQAVADPDGIPSYLEDDGDGYMWIKAELPDGAKNPDDTDGDGIPDFLDTDDDGDNYATKLEIKNTITGLPYPFEQIPTCASGKKNYLDASCHP